MTLRILQLNFHRGWGGQPSRILIASRELARRGHRVALAIPGDGILARRAREAGLEVFGDFGFRKPRQVASFARDISRLRRIIREFRPEILHAHGSQDTWTAAIASRLARQRPPLVLTRHNSKSVACHAGNRWLYGRAVDLLVVVSAGVLERYEEFFHRGILDPAGIPVIHSTIDFARFDAPTDPLKVRRELGVQDGEPLIGSVGRLVKDKGHAVLLRAMPRILASRPRARLALAGAGTEEPALRALAAELGLADRVAFLGFREDVPSVTAALDVAVLPSVDCDASPAAVKEAMYLRRPVVVSDIGGLNEIVEEGVTGCIVPPGDPPALAAAILGLIDDPEKARAMASRAREVVSSRFTVAAMVDAYERAYARLVRPAPPP